MNRFLKELRRREVFRTAGLYVGICWIVIEAASILLPTFEAPDWVLRGIIIAAFAGFPVMLVLAWFYDITDRGIEKEHRHAVRGRYGCEQIRSVGQVSVGRIEQADLGRGEVRLVAFGGLLTGC